MGAPGRCWLGREGSSDGEAGGGAGEEMQATGLVAVVLGKWHFLRESSSEII